MTEPTSLSSVVTGTNLGATGQLLSPCEISTYSCKLRVICVLITSQRERQLSQMWPWGLSQVGNFKFEDFILILFGKTEELGESR